MSRRLQAECKLWFRGPASNPYGITGGEEFFGEFDQFFYINAAEPSVGLFSPWCELDGGPEHLLIYDSEDTLVCSTCPEYSAMLKAFEHMYESTSGQDRVKDQCWDSCAGAEGRRD